MKYAVVIEKSKNGFASYVPDLPGCIAAGDTVEQTEELIREAIEFHIEGMRANGEVIPKPTAVAHYVSVSA